MQAFTLAPATEEHLSDILVIIHHARTRLGRMGVDQWQGEYPNRDSIVSDIARNVGLVLLDGTTVAGYLALDFDGEPAYETLDGTWNHSCPYAVIHRTAIHDDYVGQGLGGKIFAMVEEIVSARHVNYLRIDTATDNPVMKHLIEKTGYQYCGTVYYDHGIRICYDKYL